jgi:hypothetical protein
VRFPRLGGGRGKLKLALACAALALGIVAGPLTASGPPKVDVVADWEVTDNLTPLGFSPRPNPAPGTFNSDLAFWGDWAFQGTYDGFRIVDITYPQRPRERLFQPCNGNQGDIVVWGDSKDRPDLLVRSYNSPAPAGVTCDGQAIPEGFEGIHVFDLSNFGNPQLVAQVPVSGGSHTATLVPDTANDRVIIYNQTSGSSTPFISIIEVPLGNLAGTSVIGTAPLMHADACHDSGVILGNVNKMVCASHDAANVYDIGDNEIPGGSLTAPQFLYTISEPGVGIGGNWHSGAWTFDGKVIILGWEPGGGSQPRCTATGTVLPGGTVQTDTHKSYFFYDAADGSKLGQFVLPRDQTIEENCTIHNYNVVPRRTRPASRATCSWRATTRPASAWSTSPTRRTRRRSPTRIRLRSSRRSSAATGPPTGTTAASTSPTSRAGSSSGGWTTRRWARTSGRRTRTRRRWSSRSTRPLARGRHRYQGGRPDGRPPA